MGGRGGARVETCLDSLVACVRAAVRSRAAGAMLQRGTSRVLSSKRALNKAGALMNGCGRATLSRIKSN